MMTIAPAGVSEGGLRSVPSFRAWQANSVDRGLLPVVAIAGGRGKSTVARMVEAIVNQALLRAATWTNLGVELRGKRQRGEISGWALALSRLADSTLDVAIQEIHWSTINAVGLPPSSYPVIAMTNLAGVAEHAPIGNGTDDAIRGAYRASAAVHHRGVLVASADDPGLYDAARQTQARLVVTALSRESPILRHHLEMGGSGVWVEDDHVVGGELVDNVTICHVNDLACGHHGTAQFQIANALTAIAIASAIGIDRATTMAALSVFLTTADVLPGSFNSYQAGNLRIVIDTLVPSWHLRPLLRAVNPGNHRRQITVIGDLDGLPADDVREVGRLLGRHPGAIVLHSNRDSRRVDAFRRGIAANDYPPIVIHLPTERRAINRALRTVRGEDVALFLTSTDAGAATRAVQRFLVSPADQEPHLSELNSPSYIR